MDKKIVGKAGLGDSLQRSTIRRIGLIVFRALLEAVIFHLSSLFALLIPFDAEGKEVGPFKLKSSLSVNCEFRITSIRMTMRTEDRNG